MVGEIVGTVWSESSRVQCSIVFGFGFSDLSQAWHDSNDGLDDNLSWGHDMPKALCLPLHDAIAKSRVINIGWNFMLILCASCE